MKGALDWLRVKLTRPVTITVTAEDIANGRAANSQHCPVALAARRAFSTLRLYVFAGGITVHPSDLTSELWESDTNDLRNFVRSVDMGLEVQPTTFTVRLKDFRRYPIPRTFYLAPEPD